MGGVSVIDKENMDRITFKWNHYAACWECVLPEETIYMHKYPPSHTLVSIQKNKYVHASHEIFESVHSAQHYIGLKYNVQVQYRDPNEEKNPHRDLLEQYI